MRIDNKPPTFITDSTDISTHNQKTSSTTSDVSTSSSQAKTASTTQSTLQDALHISSSQILLKEIKEKLVAMPDTREDLIKELRHRFETDTYNVSGSEIATKIVNTAYNKLF